MTFSAGETGGVRRTVMVQIIGDEESEPDETITVSLIPQRAEGDDGLTVAITIVDDERGSTVLFDSIFACFI